MEGSLERGQWSTGSDDKEVFELGQPACQCAKVFFPALAYILVEINRHGFPSQIGAHPRSDDKFAFMSLRQC